MSGYVCRNIIMNSLFHLQSNLNSKSSFNPNKVYTILLIISSEQNNI